MGKTIFKKTITIMMSLIMCCLSVGAFSFTANTAKAADYGIGNPRLSADGVVTWDKIQFGSYIQSVKFEKQPIKWRILSVNDDGTDAFVMADRGLDCTKYDIHVDVPSVPSVSFKLYYGTVLDLKQQVTWEDSDIRKWLNNDFINEAFTVSEQSAIKETTVLNNEKNEAGIEGGNDTSDKVYLLSVNEANNQAYGFINDSSRAIKATDQSVMNGALRCNVPAYEGNCSWWLRSPGYDGYDASYVDIYGKVVAGGYNARADKWNYAVCPVLHVDLNSEYVKTAGETDSDGKVTSLNDGYNNPKVSKETTTWDCIYFGNYDQNNICEKEPIEWKVLSVNGDDAFVMADKGLDCKLYNEKGTDRTDEKGAVYTDYSCTWETCTLRGWLNGEFLNEAFSPAEQSAIKDVTVNNTDLFWPETRAAGGNNTIDKIYLLSDLEIVNQNYGFLSGIGYWCRTRFVKATDYAVSKGAFIYKENDTRLGNSKGNCSWWLRSPGGTADSAVYVSIDGSGQLGGRYVYQEDNAVCPVMHINLASGMWKSCGMTTSTSGTPQPYVASSQDDQKITPTIDKDTKKITISSVKCKKNSKKITGKVSVKGAVIKIKVDKAKYKKATLKGKKFSLKLSKKLKKNTVITITASKKNYKKYKGTYKVK